MRIKFKADFITKSGIIKRDKEVDMDDALAKQYVKDGYAVAVEAAQKKQATRAK